MVVDEPQIVVFKGSFKLAAEPRGVARSAALAAAEMVLVSLHCYIKPSFGQCWAGQTCPPQQSVFCDSCCLVQDALPNPKMPILSQKRDPYTGNLNSETPGDSKNAFLHCGDVLELPLTTILLLSLLQTCSCLSLWAVEIRVVLLFVVNTAHRPIGLKMSAAWPC